MLQPKSIETDASLENQHPRSERSGNGSYGRGWLVIFWTIVTMMTLTILFFPLIGESTKTDVRSIIVFFSTLIPICSLLGAYAGLGNHFLRWMATLIAGPVIGGYANFAAGGGELVEFEIFCLGIVGTVALTTLVLRWCKGCLSRLRPEELHSDGLQFGIKDLLIWTTVAAVLVTIGQALIQYSDRNDLAGNQNQFPMIIGLAVSLSVATVINIWAFFGNKISILKVLTILLMTGCSVASCFWLSGVWTWGTISLVNQFVIVALMIALRKYGYRFVQLPDSKSIEPVG